MSQNNEFRPLMAPRIGPDTPSEAVSWFQNLAPSLSQAPAAPAVALPPRQDWGGSATPAAFRNVDDMVREEQARSRRGIAEPPEITALREEARRTTQELIAKAHLEAQTIAQEARKQGQEAGYQQGYAEGTHDAHTLVQQEAERERVLLHDDIDVFIAHVESERQRAWAEMEPQVISLVFDIVRHIIKQEVETNREVALGVVRNALRRVSESGTLRIRVHADDLETVRGNREDLLTLVDNVRHVEIIEDRRVGQGGCIVETSAGNIDARLETQLGEVQQGLMATLERSGV